MHRKTNIAYNIFMRKHHQQRLFVKQNCVREASSRMDERPTYTAKTKHQTRKKEKIHNRPFKKQRIFLVSLFEL
jgi:hypothetical protein